MKKPRVFRDFKWEASNCRPVALKVSYFGANYHGFSSTNLDSVPTVEAFLFNALMTAKLIPASSECSWSKCGRTDKGVNAFSQVCSLYIRTVRPSIIKWTDIRSLEDYKHSLLHCTEEKHHLADYIATLNNHECDDIGEMDYVSLINKLLPEDIRVITWCPVDIRFDARFTCSYRTYDYHFSLSDSGSDLDIQAMQKGAHLFKGIHDFRNVAKIDTEKMEKPDWFTRSILRSEISHVEENFYKYTVTGRAFLWHQVRNMVSVLFLIGKGKESFDIVNELLQCKKGKPVYLMAPDDGLTLVDVGYDVEMKWRLCKSTSLSTVQSNCNAIKMRQLQHDQLLGIVGVHPFSTSKMRYVNLMKRDRCDSLEILVQKKKNKEKTDKLSE